MTNTGPDTAQSVVVTDPIPSGTSFDSSSETGCAFSSGTVTCSLGDFASGDSLNFTITVNVTAPGKSTITNTIDVSSSTFDPNSSNDSSTVSSRVVGKPH